MTYLIAAAGTGGHVFPGLAVGEALVDLGANKSDVTFVGGNRLEARVYPQNGFRFLEVNLAGLQRSLTLKNLRLPGIVRKARNDIATEIKSSDTKAVLGMGGYVTVPAALAAKKTGTPLFIAEQNAGAGLANRIASRWARHSFVSFPETGGLEGATWVGNPVRRPFRSFDRDGLSEEAKIEFDLHSDLPSLGVFGGSLGSLAINRGVAEMLEHWDGPPMQVLHLTGESHIEEMSGRSVPEDVIWRRLGFTERIELFFSICDVVVARGGGGLAEIIASGTPSILVPGEFGSSGHQQENSAFLERAGAARVVQESHLAQLSAEVGRLLFDPVEMDSMRAAAIEIARPDAAIVIAKAMMEVVS